MSKKIVFTGPPKVGKTTLRKIFFEGENPSKLLEYSLTPTHGQESILLNLKEKVGVFDLAGQENQRWYETEAKSVFFDTQIIIVVLDSSSPKEEIVKFTKKVLKLRDEITPSSFVYLLLHKIDLISKDKLKIIKDKVNDEFQDVNLLEIAYTSIMKYSFLPTFTLFTEILKLSLGIKKDENEKYSLKFLEYVVSILNIIDQNVVIPKEDIKRDLKLPDKIFNNFIEYLEKMEFLEASKLNKKPVISLTKAGKNYINEIVGKFSIESIQNFKNNIEESKFEEIPSFLGFLIADRNGRTISATEVYEGAFGLFLKYNDEVEKGNELDLIPMFISALEKFAEEINIMDLPGFKLEGSNLKIHTIKYDICTLCLFMRNDVNFNSVKKEVFAWFDNLMETYQDKLKQSIESGNMVYSSSLHSEAKKWLEQMNKNYDDLLINLKIYNFEHVKKLYQKLDELYLKIDFKYSMILEKLKKLKINLMESAMDNNFQSFKDIVKKIKELDS
ncbi:GTPase domain-containing protein [Promethearchaeum syntrophicum]|uniref:GTPase domain-containing protein n=1 Tax=Promethearchaeum syntrophicum TaxID=2594042 RepID=A0A5B9DD29_9ARCH|nr:hypothetical protein [Candidatus Prometheoarchaeum syntrophicum]QEE16616.1 hypothetical protein DSAG12_02446 [Candidatus Prometheoarchaeum syntrophicum]